MFSAIQKKNEICIQIRSLKITNPQSSIDKLFIGILENLPKITVLPVT